MRQFLLFTVVVLGLVSSRHASACCWGGSVPVQGSESIQDPATIEILARLGSFDPLERDAAIADLRSAKMDEVLVEALLGITEGGLVSSRDGKDFIFGPVTRSSWQLERILLDFGWKSDLTARRAAGAYGYRGGYSYGYGYGGAYSNYYGGGCGWGATPIEGIEGEPKVSETKAATSAASGQLTIDVVKYMTRNSRQAANRVVFMKADAMADVLVEIMTRETEKNGSDMRLNQLIQEARMLCETRRLSEDNQKALEEKADSLKRLVDARDRQFKELLKSIPTTDSTTK